MTKDNNEKTIKGKDRDGTFHPGKGKPSGINKAEGLGLQPIDPEKFEQDFEMTDKYTAGEDILADNLPVKHPNRNTSKGGNTTNAKRNKGGGIKSNYDSSFDDRIVTVPEQLPGVLTKDRFAELANYKADCTVSLYIPTHRAGVEVNEHFDRVGFKSILNTVEQQLNQKGYSQQIIQDLLKPGYDLIHDETFWTTLSDGLAVFISNGFFKYIKMPATTEQKIVIEPTFYVTPLIPVMTSNEYFYLLVISKQTAKLFKADLFGMQIVPVKVPQGVDEVKRLADPDSLVNRHGDSGRRGNAAALSGQAHGAGEGNPDAKENLATYFEAVDDLLWKEVFNKENAPLVLAGVEYEIPIYKSVCDYHNVWEHALTGSREHQTTDVLYQDAKALMQPYFEQKLNKALDRYGNKSATELTSSIVEDVIPAAYYGRVSHLFVCKGYHSWGSFDEMANEIKLHETQNAESEDLIDNAVVKTLATGGEVFLLDKEKMPAGSMVAALMRY